MRLRHAQHRRRDAVYFKYALDVVVNALKYSTSKQDGYEHSKLGKFNLEINKENAWTLSFDFGDEDVQVKNSNQLLDYVYRVHKPM